MVVAEAASAPPHKIQEFAQNAPPHYRVRVASYVQYVVYMHVYNMYKKYYYHRNKKFNVLVLFLYIYVCTISPLTVNFHHSPFANSSIETALLFSYPILPFHRHHLRRRLLSKQRRLLHHH